MSSGNQLPNLDKIFRDDDELDFLPSGGSNLAAIFGVQVKGQDKHSSTKQIHKKPNNTRNITQATSASKTEVIIAKTVSAFKLQNGTYMATGKLGIALTGNIVTRIYQIILYNSKQEHVSVVTISHDFSYTVQENNYSSYYDSNKENWSILFENHDVCIEFAREVGLARYFSKDGRIENVLYQDLTPLNKDTVIKEGNIVSIKYFIATEISQPFNSNSIMLQTMAVEISANDTWERVLLGTNKGLKRILFLPPNKQLSLGPGFPKEKDIMLEVEIIDIRKPEENSTLVHKVGSNKASIISRMAKMGQSMLPKLPSSTTTDSEDTEDDVPVRPTLQKKEISEDIPKTISKVLKSINDVPTTNITSSKPLVPAATFTPQWSPTQLQSNYVTLDGQVYSIQPQSIAPTIPTVIDPNLNMFLSETRIANAELRMGMSKIADNVQKLLDKFHVLELQNVATPTSEKTTMDTLKMLLTMNASQIGTTMSECEKGIDAINNVSDNKLSEVSEIKKKMAVLEKEVKDSKDALANSTQMMKDIEAQKEHLITENKNSCKRIQELETLLRDVNDTLRKMEKDFGEAQKLNNEYKKNNAVLEEKISDFHVKYATLENTLKSMDERDNESKNKEIKHIMNETYHTLLDKFVDESYSIDYIKATIASTIKNITLRVLYESSASGIKKSESVKTTQNDSTKTDNNMHEAPTVSNFATDSSRQSEAPKSSIADIMSVVRDEPPPIPPMDTEVDSDWLE